MLASVKIRFIAFLCVCAGFCASAAEDYTVQNGVATVDVQSLGNAKALAALQAALDNDNVVEVIVTDTITLTSGTYLSATDIDEGRKIVRVEKPFLPENGAVVLTASKTGGSLDTIVSPAVGSIRRRIVRPVVDLPHPDSPTRPRVLPLSRVKLTPSTA